MSHPFRCLALEGKCLFPFTIAEYLKFSNLENTSCFVLFLFCC